MEASNLKVALVHDWLNGMRGGEKVLENLCELFPQAPIFTLHSELGKISETITRHPLRHSFIQHLPFKKNLYRWYLPLFPWAVKRFSFENFDLILSTSHCAAKNIVAPSNIPHLCYCFSPMRYLWELQDDYFGKNSLKQRLLSPVMKQIKKWDFDGAKRVSQFIAISKTISERIQKCYERDSLIIFPPNEIPFCPEKNKEDYLLVLSALVPYKRIEQTIEACNLLKIPLKIAGTGPEEAKLRKLAGPQTQFLGWVTESQKRDLLRKARALLFPGYEDFGIVPLEAMSFATPVIGYGKGGLSETVVNGKTGILYPTQSSSELVNSIKALETTRFQEQDFQKALSPFSPEIFKQKMRTAIQNVLEDFAKGNGQD